MGRSASNWAVEGNGPYRLNIEHPTNVEWWSALTSTRFLRAGI
jgi:hypothetical protein